MTVRKRDIPVNTEAEQYIGRYADPLLRQAGHALVDAGFELVLKPANVWSFLDTSMHFLFHKAIRTGRGKRVGIQLDLGGPADEVGDKQLPPLAIIYEQLGKNDSLFAQSAEMAMEWMVGADIEFVKTPTRIEIQILPKNGSQRNEMLVLYQVIATVQQRIANDHAGEYLYYPGQPYFHIEVRPVPQDIRVR